MILLLTLAGRDPRFTSQGFMTPKYLLPWGDQTILSAILGEFLGEHPITDVLLVANKHDDKFAPHIRAIMQSHGVGRDRLVLVGDTRGQAETAMLGIEALEKLGADPRAPIVISSIDTIIYSRHLGRIGDALHGADGADGFVDVFRANNKTYSYVLLEQGNRVREIAEKIVVSDTATSGLYGFRTMDTFKRYYDSATDVFVSAVFKRMIADHRVVVAGDRYTAETTVVLDTPDQYMNSALVKL